MNKILCGLFIGIIFSVFSLFHHEQSLAFEKKDSVDITNSSISLEYKKFDTEILLIRSKLVNMQEFFESDPSDIPNIYDKYYLMLNEVKTRMINLEKLGLKLQNLCSDLEFSSNEICMIYAQNGIGVKHNNKVVVDEFNEVITKYNDMSLSDYEVFR